jgi:hypothetical protein
MPYRTTQPPDPGTALFWPLTCAKTACTSTGRRLHAVPDAIATRLDWDVTVTHWGLGRVYRDRRFGVTAENPPPHAPEELP